MAVGSGLFLAAVGAILAFAVHTTVSGVDLRTVGVILMAVGVLGVVLDLALFAPRRRVVRRPVVERAVVERPVVDDRYEY